MFITLEGQDFLTYDLNEKQILIDDKSNDKKVNKVFCFDDVFSEEATQEQIYEQTGQKMVKEVL